MRKSMTKEEAQSLALSIATSDREATLFLVWFNSFLSGKCQAPEKSMFYTNEECAATKAKKIKEREKVEKIRENETDKSSLGITKEAAHKRALRFFRFVFEALGITPEEAYEYSNKEFISTRCKLDIPFKYVIFPPEITGDEKYRHIPALVYPEYFDVENSREYLWLREYNKLLLTKKSQLSLTLTDDLSSDINKVTFLFSWYLRSNPHKNFTDIPSMYLFFAGPSGTPYVNKAKLSKQCDKIFGSPLDLFHESLPNSSRDNLMYEYAWFTANAEV